MKDTLVRAIADNAQIRAFAVRTTDMTETARRAHDTSPVVTAALGRLMSGAAMMGSMLGEEDELLTLKVDGDGDVGEICRLTGLERNFKILKRPDEQFPTIKVVGLKLFYNSPEGVEDPVTDMNDNQVPEQE